MNRQFLLSVAAALALTGCASVAPSAGGPDMTFSQYAPVDLNIGNVQVVNNTAASGNPRVSPSVALQNYANRRLRAGGTNGTLVFEIQQASLTTREVPRTGKVAEAFTLANPLEYTVTMRVGLNANNRTTLPDVKAAFTLERKLTLPGGTSLADRDSQLNDLITGMIYDVDKAVGQNLGDNMQLLSSPVTFGAPPRPVAVPVYAPVQPMPATVAPTAIEN
jgi:hypothetical protein